MPIYEYRCKDCGQVSEFQMKMSDPHPETCPSCGHKSLAKIMSLPSFQLKGGGWYNDAYDGKSNKKGDASPKSEPSSTPAASESSSSATPASSSGSTSGGTPSSGAAASSASTKKD